MFLLLRYSITLNTQHILTILELLIKKASKAASLFSLFRMKKWLFQQGWDWEESLIKPVTEVNSETVGTEM